MSFDPFGRSEDLAKLVAEGFELEVTAGSHLLVRSVPFRTPGGEVDRGTIVTKLGFDGDTTVNPVGDHTIRFVGGIPCDATGPLHGIINQERTELERDLVVDCQLSIKPQDGPTPGQYPDYYEQVTYYVGKISAEAQALDPAVADARTGGPSVVKMDGAPFEYADSASGRAGIGAITGQLADQRIAIVGVGGTGSYILDLVAKCPVAEIHLFDGDDFSSHNAFRAPGAPSLERLRTAGPKVAYFNETYSAMKRGIVPHAYDLDESNAHELQEMSFVFLAMEGGEVKRQLVEALERMDVAFIDCGLGVVKTPDEALVGLAQINASTPDNREALHRYVDFGALDDDEYEENIQIADLNALNAIMAVMWWKRYAGMYHGTNLHHHQRYNSAFSRLTVRG